MTDKKPMYFASLEIENVKCFGKTQCLDLKNDQGGIAQWTLILGSNGLGKTTLLKCIAWMNTVEESDANIKEEHQIPENMIAIKPFMDGIDDDHEYVQLARIGQNITTNLMVTLTNGVTLGNVPNPDQLVRYGIEIKTDKGELIDVKPKLAKLPEFNAPNIYAYSASRHMEIKNLDRTELVDPVSNLFSDSGELFDATEQLLYQDHAALQEDPKGKETALLNKIKQLISDLLPEIDSPKGITIHAKDRTVRIKTPDGEVPLHQMSLGYKTMVAWSVDLALKMLNANPESEDPLGEPAVVIIDEIDLHLHPTWQRSLKTQLTKHFPKTQFICTAHSPFMAQASEMENLCVLQRDQENENEVHIENSPYVVRGWRIGQIITSDLFGIEDEHGPEIEILRKERQAILDKITMTPEDEQRLKQLDEELDSLPVLSNPAEEGLLDQVKKMAKLLKEGQSK